MTYCINPLFNAPRQELNRLAQELQANERKLISEELENFRIDGKDPIVSRFTGHELHPDSAREVLSRLIDAAREGKDMERAGELIDRYLKGFDKHPKDLKLLADFLDERLGEALARERKISKLELMLVEALLRRQPGDESSGPIKLKLELLGQDSAYRDEIREIKNPSNRLAFHSGFCRDHVREQARETHRVTRLLDNLARTIRGWFKRRTDFDSLVKQTLSVDSSMKLMDDRLKLWDLVSRMAEDPDKNVASVATRLLGHIPYDVNEAMSQRYIDEQSEQWFDQDCQAAYDDVFMQFQRYCEKMGDGVPKAFFALSREFNDAYHLPGSIDYRCLAYDWSLPFAELLQQTLEMDEWVKDQPDKRLRLWENVVRLAEFKNEKVSSIGTGLLAYMPGEVRAELDGEGRKMLPEKEDNWLQDQFDDWYNDHCRNKGNEGLQWPEE